jgi:predicted RNA binding protein YcfA (HicA-like mRNA interferase family)
MAEFPSMKARDLVAVLMRSPLNYAVARPSGSHRRLKSPGRPSITFAYHDRATLGPAAVRKVLVRDVGLSEDEALRLLS